MLIKGKRRFVLVAAASGLAEDATGDPKPDPDEDFIYRLPVLFRAFDGFSSRTVFVTLGFHRYRLTVTGVG